MNDSGPVDEGGESRVEDTVVVVLLVVFVELVELEAGKGKEGGGTSAYVPVGGASFKAVAFPMN